MSLGQLEQAVMDLLWDHEGKLTANEVRDRLIATNPQGPAPVITTVLTVLSRLNRKGFVNKDGGRRPHGFSASRSREEHTVEVLNEVLGAVPDRQAVLARLIGGISAEEASTLRKLLDEDDSGNNR